MGVKKTVIVKPEDGSQGDGIFLAHSLRDVETRLHGGLSAQAVVQRYVKKPMLIKGLKFDFRVYVLLIGLGSNQRVFICEEGLGRFCTEHYEQPGTKHDNSKQLLGHLTNYSLNKRSTKFQHTEEAVVMETDKYGVTTEVKALDDNGDA